MDQETILNFAQISADDLARVGGKGANLGEMAAAGFPIPPGFCITTEGFNAFIKCASEMDSFYDRLAQLTPGDVESVRRVGEELRYYLAGIPIPNALAADLLQAWRTLGTDAAYAVRSSATAEDLPTASFAGQQDTFLNVSGEIALLERVRSCWISLFTDRAILYRARNGFDHRQVQLSVVVQQMVFPEVSGIAFTADPVSGHRKIISIDASYGLGEALVAGLVSADLYKVDRRSWQVVEVNVADKRLAVLPKPDGGTYQEMLGSDRRHTQALAEDQVIELARIAARIEDHYGAPQDIEWALAGGMFYILQSRPITSLFPLPPATGELSVYFSLSHAQVMTDVMSPMGISVWKLLFPFGRPDGVVEYNRYLHGVGGRMYVDITPLLRTKLGRRGIPNMLMIADELSAYGLKPFLHREEFLEAAAQSSHVASFPGVMHWIGPLFPVAIRRLWFARPESAVPLIEIYIRESIEAGERLLASAQPGLERLKTAYAFTARTFVENAKRLMPFVMTIMMAKTLLERLVRGSVDPSDLTAVYSGLEGNVTTNMDLEVGDLSDIARQHPAVAELLRSGRPADSIEKSSGVEGGEAFKDSLDKFLEKYGMRGPSEIDIARPRWKDDPGSLLQMVLGGTGHAEKGGHRDYHRRLVEQGWEAGERLERAVRKGPKGFIHARLVRRFVRVFRSHMAVREHPKFMLIKMFGMVREILLESANTLVDENRLERIEDVWMLEFHEVVQAFEQPEMELRGLVNARYAEQKHFRDLVPPRLFTSDGELLRGQYSREDLPEGALPGSSVSGGVVEGIARVVTDPTAEVLHPGEILVAPFTDPGWTPLFIHAAGLVMEVGGLMTHGSVIAREYGIPAVVGVVDATRQIKTGQRIRVQGDAGYVEYLNEEGK